MKKEKRASKQVTIRLTEYTAVPGQFRLVFAWRAGRSHYSIPILQHEANEIAEKLGLEVLKWNSGFPPGSKPKEK